MTQIGATDQVLLLLREQLQRIERTRGRTLARKEGGSATPQQRIEMLAAIETLPERDFRRALLRGLLSERLGAELIADPAFEAVTGEVLKMIEDSEETGALLDRVSANFRAPR